MTTALTSFAALYVRMACVPLIWGGTFIAGRVVSGDVGEGVSGGVVTS